MLPALRPRTWSRSASASALVQHRAEWRSSRFSASSQRAGPPGEHSHAVLSDGRILKRETLSMRANRHRAQHDGGDGIRPAPGKRRSARRADGREIKVCERVDADALGVSQVARATPQIRRRPAPRVDPRPALVVAVQRGSSGYADDVRQLATIEGDSRRAKARCRLDVVWVCAMASLRTNAPRRPYFRAHESGPGRLRDNWR